MGILHLTLFNRSEVPRDYKDLARPRFCWYALAVTRITFEIVEGLPQRFASPVTAPGRGLTQR